MIPRAKLRKAKLDGTPARVSLVIAEALGKPHRVLLAMPAIVFVPTSSTIRSSAAKPIISSVIRSPLSV